MRTLVDKGADVRFHDPYVDEFTLAGRTLTSVPLDASALGDVDLVVVLTAHPGIDWDAVLAAGVPVLDTRNALDARADNVHGL
jgi:UDP-N-acetyl-D-glucosamine dehydrogenase